MLQFTSKGIYCPVADIYIDPWRPVGKAVITHAHSDHARFGMGSYLCSPPTAPVLKLRLGSDIQVQTVPFGTIIDINGVKLSLHPAGHIWGSAQVRLEYKGEVWVVSGDYKLSPDGCSEPFESVKCHSFITECTFGLPIYRFPEAQLVHENINEWWEQNRLNGKNSLLLTYSLGKAQRVIRQLNPDIGPIYTHGAVDNINQLYLSLDGKLPPTTRITPDLSRKDIRGAMIVAPPSVAGSSWMRSLQPLEWGICSGWMQLRGARRRRGSDRGFVLSDHADWDQLNEAVKASGAENIYATHGYKSAFSRWLNEAYGLNAVELETEFTGESLEESNNDTGKDYEGV
ncbi:ligase-associated DNA damage response exonuclease [Rurimicrobium arvi]|uniref:Ligase-associated DNA damage response exonuclease n=1 Tax=Rurimicrobium arvi TaxID=2049916 RepID=A0ABP8MVM1_9BACT